MFTPHVVAETAVLSYNQATSLTLLTEAKNGPRYKKKKRKKKLKSEAEGGFLVRKLGEVRYDSGCLCSVHLSVSFLWAGITGQCAVVIDSFQRSDTLA